MKTIFKNTEIFKISYDLKKSQQIKKVVEIATNKNNLKCFEFEIEQQNFYKNGKPKGKSCLENKKHFFEIYEELEQYSSYIKLLAEKPEFEG